MRTRSSTTALIAVIIAGSIGLTTVVQAQSRAASDSMRRWSLFGGSAFSEEAGIASLPHNLAIGASADFRLGNFPLPLRATLAFDASSRRYDDAPLRAGTLSLDAVGRPVPRFLGTQLYFLGGLGMATRSGFSNYRVLYANAYPPQAVGGYMYDQPRQTWAFVEGGLGLEIGRMFLETKLQMPVASEGYHRTPVSIGFRF